MIQVLIDGFISVHLAIGQQKMQIAAGAVFTEMKHICQLFHFFNLRSERLIGGILCAGGGKNVKILWGERGIPDQIMQELSGFFRLGTTAQRLNFPAVAAERDKA